MRRRLRWSQQALTLELRWEGHWREEALALESARALRFACAGAGKRLRWSCDGKAARVKRRSQRRCLPELTVE